MPAIPVGPRAFMRSSATTSSAAARRSRSVAGFPSSPPASGWGHCHDRAGHRLGSTGRAHAGRTPRRELCDQRVENLHLQRPSLRPADRRLQDQSGRGRQGRLAAGRRTAGRALDHRRRRTRRGDGLDGQMVVHAKAVRDRRRVRAFNSSAATATCSSIPSRACTPTPGYRRSTAAPTRS